MGKKLRDKLADITGSSYFRLSLYFFILFFVSGLIILFLERESNEQFNTLLDGIWWAIITFSTTGYGDKVPLTEAGKIVALLTIFFGIAIMGALSGTFASIFVEQNNRARRGLMDYGKLSNHIVICGWKEHIKDILQEILHCSPELSSDQIVILSNIDTETFDALKEVENLKNLRFVRGDYFSEAALKRANVEKAHKVIILADTLESHSLSEVDPKTVMTVLTIKAMSKDVHVCAELLDDKFESYLKNALCDEIIFPRSFSNQIIANSTKTNGLPNILSMLLSHGEEGTELTTEPVPPEFVGQTYREYRDYIAGTGNRILIGVLENTGSPNKVKIEALREAQKTPDISTLVGNLQYVKELEVNKPRLMPEEDYQIQRYSQGILVKRRTA